MQILRLYSTTYIAVEQAIPESRKIYMYVHLSMLRDGKIFLNFDYFRKILAKLSLSSVKTRFRQAMSGTCVGYCCYCQETVKTLKYF